MLRGSCVLCIPTRALADDRYGSNRCRIAMSAPDPLCTQSPTSIVVVELARCANTGRVLIPLHLTTIGGLTVGIIENASHVFQPDARFCSANSQYPLRLKEPCISPTGNKTPTSGPTAATRDI